ACRPRRVLTGERTAAAASGTEAWIGSASGWPATARAASRIRSCRPRRCKHRERVMNAELRRIRSDEGLKLRSLRLRALADAPMAFGSTLAREESFPESVWHERAAGGASGTDRVTFIGERDG